MYDIIIIGAGTAGIAAYKEAITEAMFRGTKRNIESEEENAKNVAVG